MLLNIETIRSIYVGYANNISLKPIQKYVIEGNNLEIYRYLIQEWCKV